MKEGIRQLDTIASNPWFLVANGFASIAIFMWFIYGETTGNPETVSLVLLVISLIVLSVACIYSIKVRVENIALRSISELFYEINEIYRDKLREMFCSDAPVTAQMDLLAEEELALKAVCERIERIFNRVTHRSCLVTIKLVTIDNEKCYAHTYVRSQQLCQRDSAGRKRYAVGSGENTAFDMALAKRPDGLPSHFYSGDLRKLEIKHAYFNERQHYQRYYKSTLVVPIRGRNTHTTISSPEFDLVGFLCIDTLSVNRLNNGFHLYMLSALASQMYNFMSFMRGKYTVFVE